VITSIINDFAELDLFSRVTVAILLAVPLVALISIIVGVCHWLFILTPRVSPPHAWREESATKSQLLRQIQEMSTKNGVYLEFQGHTQSKEKKVASPKIDYEYLCELINKYVDDSANYDGAPCGLAEFMQSTAAMAYQIGFEDGRQKQRSETPVPNTGGNVEPVQRAHYYVRPSTASGTSDMYACQIDPLSTSTAGDR